MKRPGKNADILGVPHKSRKQKEDRKMQTKTPRKSRSKLSSVLAYVFAGFFVILGNIADTIALMEWVLTQDWTALIAWFWSNLPWL